MDYLKKKLLSLVFLITLITTTVYSDSFFIIKHGSKNSYDPIILTPKDSLVETTHPRSPEAYIELSYFMYEPKSTRIKFICLKKNYDFDEAYSATMWFLEEFCIEYNYRRPVVRKHPSERYERRGGFEYVIYEAYVDLKDK